MANNINSKWVQNMKHPLLVPFLVSVLGAIKYPPQINREDSRSVDRDSCHLKRDRHQHLLDGLLISSHHSRWTSYVGRLWKVLNDKHTRPNL